ncbi:hypothetical protein LH128_00125 [Sphingomonas sp. LH128]|nr:hypothetical protein LH128_00125 [Sphingomonas sp. LH128]
MALGLWAALTTLLSAILGVWNFRITRHKAQTELPYIQNEIHNGAKIVLSGPSASIWQISEIKLIAPKSAEFIKQHMQYDDGGSITASHTTREGRILKGGEHYLVVASSVWPADLSVTICLRSAPKTKRSLRTRVTR